VGTAEARLVVDVLISNYLLHLVDTFLALATNWSSTGALLMYPNSTYYM